MARWHGRERCDLCGRFEEAGQMRYTADADGQPDGTDRLMCRRCDEGESPTVNETEAARLGRRLT